MAQALPAVALAKAGRKTQAAGRKTQSAELGAKREDLVTSCFLLRTSVFGSRFAGFRRFAPQLRTSVFGLPSNNYHDSPFFSHTSDLTKSLP